MSDNTNDGMNGNANDGMSGNANGDKSRPQLRVLHGPSQPEPDEPGQNEPGLDESAATRPEPEWLLPGESSKSGHPANGAAADGATEGALGQTDPRPAPPGQANSGQANPRPADPLYADIEAVLLTAEEPITYAQLAAVADSDVAAVKAACAELADEYHRSGRGFEIAHIAGGIRLQTTAESAPTVRRFVAGSNSARLSAAAMETLAVVAYKQPVSRSQITAIRGVNADAVVRSLCERGYLIEDGRDPGPTNAALLRTTDLFLTQLGISRLQELPSLADMELDADMMERLDDAATS